MGPRWILDESFGRFVNVSDSQLLLNIMNHPPRHPERSEESSCRVCAIPPKPPRPISRVRSERSEGSLGPKNADACTPRSRQCDVTLNYLRENELSRSDFRIISDPISAPPLGTRFIYLSQKPKSNVQQTRTNKDVTKWP